MTGFDRLKSALDGVVPTGADSFKARCPVPSHGRGRGDKDPSLHVKESTNGRGPLLNCKAGCSNDNILSALGLSWRDDILPPREHPVPRSNVTPLPVQTSTRYEIKDTTGQHIRFHVRRDGPEGKSFHWEQPDGTQGLGGLKLADLSLYGIVRIPEDGSPVIVTEGEKAADALHANGIPAVGSVTGANGTPGDDALRPLLGRTVYLWADNDVPGGLHFDRIQEAIVRLGHQDVRRIDWTNAPPKGDAADLVQMAGWRDELDDLMESAVRVPTPKPMFESMSDLLERPVRPVWFVNNRIETPSTVLAFGPTGSGKTFVAADLAGAASVNGQWMGLDVYAPGPVFYIAGEGRTGLLRRFRAWQNHHNTTIPADRLYLSTGRIEIDEAGAEKLEQAIQEMTDRSGIPPSAIIIDTLARSLPSGADENSAKDVGAFVNRIDHIRDRFGCVVCVVHHTPISEDKRARGSSALKAAMDAELCIVKRGGLRLAEWTKLKDLPEDAQPQSFVLSNVIIDATTDGELVTSAVVDWQDTAERTQSSRTTRTEQVGLDTLEKAIEETGGLSATIEQWRVQFYMKHWGDNTKSKRTAFHRVRESLIAKEMIRVKDDQYSLYRPQQHSAT